MLTASRLGTVTKHLNKDTHTYICSDICISPDRHPPQGSNGGKWIISFKYKLYLTSFWRCPLYSQTLGRCVIFSPWVDWLHIILGTVDHFWTVVCKKTTAPFVSTGKGDPPPTVLSALYKEEDRWERPSPPLWCGQQQKKKHTQVPSALLSLIYNEFHIQYHERTLPTPCAASYHQAGCTKVTRPPPSCIEASSFKLWEFLIT